MKAIKVIFGLLMVLVLISGTPALAQEVEPPEATLLADEARDVEEGGSRVVRPATSFFAIAADGIDEKYPAVAHGGGYYMVVYERGEDIYAKVYDDNGELIDTYEVFNAETSEPCSNPSVAYEANSGFFVVTFERKWPSTNKNIFFQLVSPTTGNVEFSKLIFSSFDKIDPDVACNSLNGTCWIAYEDKEDLKINGVYFTVDKNEKKIKNIKDPYNLTDVTYASRPRLAWGNGTGYYLVTYEWYDSVNDKVVASYNKIKENWASSGNQYIHQNEIVDYDEVSGPLSTLQPDVAYDPCTDKFVIVFSHWWPSSDRIWAAAVGSGSMANISRPFPVATTAVHRDSPVISFVTDSHLTPACGRMDKLVVAYRDASVGIKATVLYGNNNTSNPLYDTQPTGQHFVVSQFNTPYNHIHPAISSGSRGAEMLIVYNRVTSDYDVWGRFVEVRDHTFLPLLVR